MKKLNIFLVTVVLPVLWLVFMTSGCRMTPQAKGFGQSLLVDYAKTTVVREAENRVDASYGNPRQPQTTVVVQQPSSNIQQNVQQYFNGEMSDGGHYEGGIFNRFPHGFGKYAWLDGYKYVGEWRNGKKDGEGTLTYPSGSKYVGEFRNDKKDGQGTLTHLDGYKYVGEWRNGKKDGQGSFTYPSGSKYVGKFKNNARDGQGTQSFKNGVFVGEFRKGEEYKGVFTSKDGTVISGEFSGGGQSGDIIYLDGRNYTGEWNGSAKFLGEKFVRGFWTYERPHGFGKMTYTDGTTKAGMWQKGEFVENSSVE